MTGVLVAKFFRDTRLLLATVAFLLGGFQCLWAKITQRITEEILPTVTKHLPLELFIEILFKGPGQLIQTLIGGATINLTHVLDVLSIGYVHPLTQTVLCVWAVGRSAGALSGELDRGTMELLLSQPIARSRLILAHFCLDVVAIIALCFSMWAGNWLGVALFGHIEFGGSRAVQELRLDPFIMLPALLNVAGLIFAVGGFTMYLSARGRFRNRVLGLAVFITLLQFIVNLVGQLWDAVACLRPLTVFYYYQPQQIILNREWSVDVASCWPISHSLRLNVVVVLAVIGVMAYGIALWTFCRRDLPAPL